LREPIPLLFLYPLRFQRAAPPRKRNLLHDVIRCITPIRHRKPEGVAVEQTRVEVMGDPLGDKRKRAGGYGRALARMRRGEKLGDGKY
jgi:type IV secretory pathway protease TraF